MNSGRRFFGLGLLRLFGLLGLLLTVGLMALLGVRVLDGMSDSARVGEEGLGASLGPALPVVPAPGGADVEPGALGDDARVAACDAERRSLGTAIQAYEILHGVPPPDMAALVREEVLDEPAGGFSHEIGPDGVPQGTGGCAPS